MNKLNKNKAYQMGYNNQMDYEKKKQVDPTDLVGNTVNTGGWTIDGSGITANTTNGSGITTNGGGITVSGNINVSGNISIDEMGTPNIKPGLSYYTRKTFNIVHDRLCSHRSMEKCPKKNVSLTDVIDLNPVSGLSHGN